MEGNYFFLRSSTLSSTAMEQELLRSLKQVSIAMKQEEAVILVVGGERMKEKKALVADMLAEGRGASHVRTTKDGAQIFGRELSPAPVVINTTDLESNYPWEDSSVSNVVRDLAPWISLNFLKQISDKPIFVVCVVECVPSGSLHFPLLEKLEFLFAEHRREIVVLVDSVEWKRAAPDHYRRPKSEFVHNLTEQGFRKNNISFVTFTRKDLHPTIKSLLESSVVNNHAEGEPGKEKMAGGKPFHVKKNTSTSTGVDFHGLWGPIPVILFGRTGSGKSTLTQMLTRGRLDSQCTDFATSSSVRGETTKLNAWEGRGWYVVDTPGFGQPASMESAVSTGEAEKRIKKYVQRIQGTFYHFLYVAMKDRMDQLEVCLWNFFTSLFGENMSQHFTVVMSNADEDWVNQNLHHLQKVFKGCQSFVGGEFPPTPTNPEEWEAELEVRQESLGHGADEVETDDETLETELEALRQASLDHLEEELHSLMRYPVTCEFGQFSKKSQEFEAVTDDLDVPVVRNPFRRTATAVKTQFQKSVWRRLRIMLMKEEIFVLLPQFV